jgi:hypothetical protein
MRYDVLGRALVIACGVVGFAASAHAQGNPGVDMAAKAQAARAVALCDGAAWEAAATMYRNNHPEKAGPFGIMAMPPDFPSYPFPCNPKVTAARPAAGTLPAAPPTTMTWAGPANWSATPFGWGPLTSDNTVGSFYVGGSVGGSQSATTGSLPIVYTIGILDNTPQAPTSGSGSFLSGGLFFGLNMFQFMGLVMGVEFATAWADKNQTFIANINNVTTGTNNDRMGFEHNHLMSLSGVITAPVNRNFSLIGRGGASWLNGNAQIGCFGSCTAAGTAPFNVSQDVDFSGWHWGVGAQGRIGMIGGMPIILRGEFVHHEFGSKAVTAGNPATASVGFTLEPKVDEVKASLILPFGPGALFRF